MLAFLTLDTKMKHVTTGAQDLTIQSQLKHATTKKKKKHNKNRKKQQGERMQETTIVTFVSQTP